MQDRANSIEELAEQRGLQFSRELEERAQAIEALAKAFSIAAVRDLALNFEQRAQVAEQSAIAFAVEQANVAVAAAQHDVEQMRHLTSENDQKTVAIARAAEERAQIAEAAAKAYTGVGLETLAKSIGANSRAMQRRTKELADRIVSLQAQLADNQERIRELELVEAALGGVIVIDQPSADMPISLPTRPRAEGGHATVTANDEIAVSRRISR